MTPRRISIVASELLGRPGTGGAGTADSLLAVALGRHGHDVQLVVASGREIGPLNADWTARYEEAGVRIRVLERLPGVKPAFLAPPYEVFTALRDDPPEVVIVDDWRGLGHSALRARQAGLAFTGTAFVVHCHGPGRVLTEFAQKIPDTLERFGEDVAERACIELADAVVSPSAWLLDWMRRHRWPVPETAQVIQYVRESAALDREREPAPPRARIQRLAFFGQVREGKGVRLFVDALGALDQELLDGVEVVFLGSARGRWAPQHVERALSPAAKARLLQIRFEPNLDRKAALDELRRPGTLAVMPSLLDNSPNTVSECIEHGIPFVATATGGIPELVAESDRERVLCRPATAELAALLERALSSPDGFAPAGAARDARASVDAWLEVVDRVGAPVRPQAQAPASVAVVAATDESARRAQRLAEQTRSAGVEVVRADSRREGVSRSSAEWILFLDNEDDSDQRLLDVLVAAQAASGADAVTPAIRRGDEVRLFLGDAGALGLVENHYGVVGLVRRSLAADPPEAAGDRDWPLFARIALSGATVLSIPEPLATHAGEPGRVDDVPGAGLAVLEEFEKKADEIPGLPQLAATLGAAVLRRGSEPRVDAQPLHARVAALVRATLARR